MSITEQFFMYQIAYDLVTKEKYELLHMNLKTNEVWITKQEKRVSKVIRFIPKGFNWKNHLKSDIASVIHRVKTMRNFFRGKSIEIYNMYVTDHEPVDDWEMLKKPMILKEKKQVKMNVFYMTENNAYDEQYRFLNGINVSTNYIPQLPEEIDQENAVNKYRSSLQHLLYEKNKEIKNVFTYGKPYFTYFFILLNFMMFVMIELNGGSMNIENLIQSGAKFNPAIIEGEWWRIVSSMFIHIGALHLLMNMIALYYIGTVVEKIYGSPRFLIIYFLAGIGGGLTSFALNVNVSAGASGALFGLFGALLFFGLMYKQLFFQTMGKNLIFILLINIIFGFLVPQIDMGAHIGGLLTGFFAAAITALPYKKNRPIQLGSFIVYSLIIAFLIIYGIQINTNIFS